MAVIHIAPHPRFDMSVNNLESVLPLAHGEAALGAKVTAHPEREHSLTVPPGSQAGQRLRSKERTREQNPHPAICSPLYK
ncbi:hypothetical protein LAD64_18405 [Klebsiella pneumoniae]|nr:hypothetical protein [Klebsiella pneumoniae]